ncbi:hypothetical protein RJ641_036098 [Dillenia turbinata]|uniref:Uncharacterized protein n=1 Tax=Dillenia turbinata TaxID=194707 RepID=A0AAN8VGM4_9MAGN
MGSGSNPYHLPAATKVTHDTDTCAYHGGQHFPHRQIDYIPHKQLTDRLYPSQTTIKTHKPSPSQFTTRLFSLYCDCFFGERERCSLDRQGNIFILTLTGHNVHRLNPTLIDSIQQTLTQIKSKISAEPNSSFTLITTGEGKFFSNGYDLNWAKTSPD